MMLMHIREVIYCPHHEKGIVVLESGTLPVHPLYDFHRRLLRTFQATARYVVLDEVTGQGLQGFVCIQGPSTRHSIPCYAPNALALALQARIPIYATSRALTHAEPPNSSPRPADKAEIRQWLAQVKPWDFLPPPADHAP